MEFRKMVTITLYVRQQKRHRCIEQSFGLCGRGRGWDDLGAWHWNIYNIIYEMNLQSRFDAWNRLLTAGALGWPEGWDGEGVGWGFRKRNTCTPMADSCQCMEKPLQYCKVISLQLKYINKFFKKRIHLPMQGTQFRSLVQKNPTCPRATKPVHHNYWDRKSVV